MDELDRHPLAEEHVWQQWQQLIKPPGQEDKKNQQWTERQQDVADLLTTLKCRKTCTPREPGWTMRGSA